MAKPNDLSRSFTAFKQDSTLIAVIEMSRTSWLVAGILPGIERHPLKKLDVDEGGLLQLLHRWRDEAIDAGRDISRIALAFEAGRDGFWRVGSGLATLRPTSFTQIMLRFPASTDGPRQTDSCL